MSLESLFDELFTASWRGVEFAMLDSRDETGRRWVRFLFPGRDQTIHEDLGAMDGTIAVQGLLVGDDYVRQAKRLREAFRAPGPATLVHPWLGELECVLAEPATITFSDKEMRVARFEASFVPWVERPVAKQDTISAILDEVDALRYQLRSWLRTVLAPVRLAFGMLGAVQSFVTGVTVTLNRVIGTARGSGTLLQQLVGPFQALGNIGSLGADDSYGAAVADRLAAPAAVIVTASVPVSTAAIGTTTPAEEASVSSRAAAQLLLDIAAAAAPDSTTLLPVLALAVQAYAVAGAAAAATGIEFESQQEAEAWRVRLDAGIVSAATGAASLATSDPNGAGPVWDALQALRAVIAIDMQARIGRLPAVVTLTLAQPSSAWALANHLVGDDPGLIVAQYIDLVSRNGIRHPAQLPAGVALERLA